MPSRTINRLHFSDLEPLRFEDLCLNLVSRLYTWKELNHFGRKGQDGGVDIHAIQEVDDGQKHWSVQCKRYLRIAKSEMESIVKNVAVSSKTVEKLLLIVSCDIGREVYNEFKKQCTAYCIPESEIWSASTLEAKLYKEHKDLLFVYFGVRLLNGTKTDNASKIRYTLKMEKRFQKDFFRANLNEAQLGRRLFHEPYLKFISDTVIIRSIDDTSYPEVLEPPEGQISPWIKEVLFDTYHNGIEIWIAAAMGHKIIMDKKGYWEVLSDYYDRRQKYSKYKTSRVRLIGQIPYSSIVDYKVDGDQYYREPHIFCRFEFNHMPYSKLYYRIYADEATDLPIWELDENKMIKFPR